VRLREVVIYILVLGVVFRTERRLLLTPMCVYSIVLHDVVITNVRFVASECVCVDVEVDVTVCIGEME